MVREWRLPHWFYGLLFARVVLFEAEFFMLLPLVSGAEEGPEYF